MQTSNTTLHHNRFGSTGDGTIRTNTISPITQSNYAFCTKNAQKLMFDNWNTLKTFPKSRASPSNDHRPMDQCHKIHHRLLLMHCPKLWWGMHSYYTPLTTIPKPVHVEWKSALVHLSVYLFLFITALKSYTHHLTPDKEENCNVVKKRPHQWLFSDNKINCNRPIIIIMIIMTMTVTCVRFLLRHCTKL